ncbi:SERine Proteinase INhibitor [Tyrophagus putrescentiae]|nr:SERine Proteinase INhibitor [Tyrophagus putrescentiae]
MRHQFAVLFVIVATVPIFTVSSKASSNGSLQIARANDYFGYKLLEHLEERNFFEEDAESENLFISPFSVSTVLTMVMAGAKGDTFEEIKNTLGVQLKLTEPQRYTAFNTLLRQLNNLSSSDTVNSLKLANAIALQTGETPLLPRYQRIVKRRLKAKIFQVNFEKEPEQAAELINQWASRKTKGKIRKLVEGTLDPGTRVVLLNALYFNGTWASPFPARRY